MRYALLLLFTLAACFTAQSLALRGVGGKTNKSESNFFSSIARIQTGIRYQPEIMFLGSSMTGRLPDRSQGFGGVANLGCDGSSAVDTLRAMDKGLLPIAPILVIEGNTLNRAVAAGPSEIARAIDSPWFRIGRKIPNLGATARPAAFAYSKLMTHKIGIANSVHALQIKATSEPAIPEGPPPTLDEEETWFIDDLAALIERLKSRGSQFLITVIPPGGTPDSADVRLPMALALKAGVRYWDLNAALPADTIKYTDRIHMEPQSAAAVTALLLQSFPR